MKPEKLTIADLETRIGIPAEEWHGKCSQLAYAAIAVMGHGDYAYGHYLGEVDPDGYWKDMGLQRHGWVLLGDGRIVDATRWSFENVEPYVFVGDNDGDYDEGGNRLRGAMRNPCPSAEGVEPGNLEEVMCSSKLFERLTGTPFHEMTVRQAAWVANTPYDELGFAVAPIYETLISNDLKMYIPIDNYRRAVREGRVKSA